MFPTMTRGRAVLLPALVLTILPAGVARGDAEGPAAGPPPEAVTRAVEAARDRGADFHLLTHCTDDRGFRSLEVFPGGVAVWNGRAQVSLDPEVRRALLDTLLEKGFATLALSYGGKPAAEAPDQPAPAAPGGAGPLQIRCRVTFESGGLSKTSIQQMDGQQSAELTGLVAALLDRVEPLAAKRGVGADDLDDGLRKVAAGELAPQLFSLRFVRLPAERSDEIGVILRLTNGTVSQRPYAPGRTVGEPVDRELGDGALAALARQIVEAGFPSLPANLHAPHHLELEVRVLNRQHTVVARPFAGMSPEDKKKDQERFDTLLHQVRRELLQEDGPSPDSTPDGAPPAGNR